MSSVGQEITLILWKPKVYYRIYSLRPVPILNLINAVRFPHPTSWRSILVFFYNIRLGILSGLFPSRFPIKAHYVPHLAPWVSHAPASHYSGPITRLTLRRLMSYIYIYIYIYMEHPFLMFLDHTQRRSTVGRTPLDE